MYATRPCTTTCVIVGAPVTFTFYPDTGVLRVCDAVGHCLREDRRRGSGAQLLDAIRELSGANPTDAIASPAEAAAAPANDTHVEAA
jgi:hypothetical protein